MARVIDDFLDLAAIEAGQLPLRDSRRATRTSSSARARAARRSTPGAPT